MFATGLVGRESWPETLVNEAPFPKKKKKNNVTLQRQCLKYIL